MKLLQELVESKQDEIDAIPLMEALEESIKTVQMQKAGGKINSALKGAKDFFKANPMLVTGAAALALNALTQYKKNQRNTIKLHGKTAYEKKMMTSIVDSMTQSGKFRIHRVKFEGGGKTWVLKKRM